MGIDEIALRKGHKDFVVVLRDLDTHRLIGMAPSRTHAAIEAVLNIWGTEVLSNVVEVSMDFSGNYRGLVRRLMPQADIVADRCHVMSLVNQELNQARNAFRRTPDDLSDGVTPEDAKAALKASKYALLKPKAHLTDTQRDKLAEVIAVSPKLALMHQSKEAFRKLFDAESWSQSPTGLPLSRALMYYQCLVDEPVMYPAASRFLGRVFVWMADWRSRRHSELPRVGQPVSS
ncbi:MAG: transposase [Leptolyngbyaceae cyanobacterium T60_A2020_046]|nr:transposase [Leptolyngbyaceae cyanobacterium T60_A2020_046]